MREDADIGTGHSYVEKQERWRYNIAILIRYRDFKNTCVLWQGIDRFVQKINIEIWRDIQRRYGD